MRLIAVPLVCLLVLAACGDQEPLTFRYQIPAAPGTLDPAGHGDAISSAIKNRLFDGLVAIDPLLGTPQPALADSWEISDDATTYTFRLLGDAVFHHGRAIRAEDVRASWERFLAPGHDSEGAYIFEPVVGVEEFRSGAEDRLRGLEILDPLTIRVSLKQPFPPFLFNLSHDGAAILPVEEAERLGDDFARNPVGSGPFRFVSWDRQVTLAAFEDHVRSPPVIDRLIFIPIQDREEALRLYQAGELDLVSRIPGRKVESLRQNYAEDLRFSPSSTWFGFCFRCDRPPFQDARVRRAFSYAIDRDALARELGEFQYTASKSVLPQSVSGFDPEHFTSGFDPAKARELLREAGFGDDEAFPAVVYTTRTETLDVRVAEHVRSALANIGIDVEVQQMEFAQLLNARGEGRLGVFRYGWGNEYPDADSNLRPLFYSSGSDNRHAYSNPDVDRLLDDARFEENASRRIELTQQAERLILDDAPCVGLYQSVEAILLKPTWTGIPIGAVTEDLRIETARPLKR